MNVLVVEDDSHVASYLTQLLSKWGHRVEVAETGKEALSKAWQNEFPLVLLDIFLPDIEGYNLIPELKEILPEINVVTMTGHNTRELEANVRTKGIAYYLIKPLELDHLKIIVEHISNMNTEESGEKIWKN